MGGRRKGVGRYVKVLLGLGIVDDRGTVFSSDGCDEMVRIDEYCSGSCLLRS